MSHEEVAATLPRLCEEAAEASARVHAAMERLAESDEVPTYVEVHGDHLLVNVRGVERAMSLLSTLRIPSSTCGAQKRTYRSSTRCGGVGGCPASMSLGFDSTTCMATAIRPS
jgi:hypothetical protein